MFDGVLFVVSKLFVVFIFGFFIIMFVWLVCLFIEMILFKSFYNVVGDLLGILLFILGGSFGGSFVVEFV